MKKLLLILLCLPLLFSSCVGDFNKEITIEMLYDGYTGQGTWTSDDWDNAILDNTLIQLLHLEWEYGSCNWHLGDKYVGDFKDGERHGNGTKTSASDYWYSYKYVGEWKEGLRNGQGTCTWDSGGKYVGEWRDGKMHGQGTYTFADGGNFVGEYKDGKENGQGVFTWNSGDKYVGECKDGKMHGQGTIAFFDGRLEKGIWENGVFLGE